MKILSFDTCNSILSIAVIENDKTIYSEIDYQSSKQAENLLPLIDKSLKFVKLTLGQIDYIAVSVGPGSFTGVRIGLSAALGFNIATNIPIIAISCLEALAYKYTDKYPKIMVTMDARRDKLYVQNFSNYIPFDEPSLSPYDEILNNIKDEEIAIIGDGTKYFKDISHCRKDKLQILSPIIDAEMVGQAAYIKIIRNIKMNNIEPLYIREASIRS